MSKLRTVFLGTPDFSVPTLQALFNNSSIDLLACISNPSKKRDRGQKIKNPPVIDFCIKNNISYYQTDKINKNEEIISFLKNSKIDLIIVLAFSQFISQEILDFPRIGCFNIHTSLLPKYRGAAPIQYALLNGDKKTGVSIQKMVKKMDAGDICYSHEVDIDENDNAIKMFEKLKNEAAISINKFIELVNKDKLIFTKQDESKVSFAPLIKKSDAKIDPLNHDFENVLNMIKGYAAWPKSFLYINKKILKIHKISKYSLHLDPGVFKIHMGQMLLGIKNGTIRLEIIQPEGKRQMTDADFLNGINKEIIIS